MRTLFHTGSFALLGAAMILAGCARDLRYHPTRQNVPLFSEQGQVRAGVYGSRGPGIQFAMSPAAHFGMTYQFQGYVTDFPDVLGPSESGWLNQFGLGVFSPLGQSGVLETYLVGGIGGVKDDSGALFGTNPTHLQARTWLVAVQPAIGYKAAPWEAGLSARTGYWGYTRVHGESVIGGVDRATDLRRHSSTLIFEPALTGRLFSKFFGVEAQYGRSWSLTRPRLRQADSWFSAGFLWRVPGVEIPERWKKK